MGLADIPPEERGVPWRVWIMEQIVRQFEEYKGLPPAAGEDEVPWLSQQRVATARDRYGWRSLPGGRQRLTARRKDAGTE